MPTKSRRAALPLLSWQGPSLCICKKWIDGGVFLVVPVHGVEFFTNTGKSLALDICSHGIRIKLTTRPAPRFGEPVRLFEQGVRYGNCGFREPSITVVIPRFKRNIPASCPGRRSSGAREIAAKNRRLECRGLKRTRAASTSAERSRSDTSPTHVRLVY
jgi:hypothetical protein